MIDSTKKKVLMVHNYYQVPGGEDTVVANEIKLLRSRHHDVLLYSRSNREIASMSILEKMCLPFTAVFNLKTYTDIRRIIKKHNVDIVHVHNTLSLISPSVYYAALSRGVPVIQTIHNFRFICPAATCYRDSNICEECVSKGLKCAVKHKCYRNSYILSFICAFNNWFHRRTGVMGKIYYIVLTDFNKKKLIQVPCINPEHVFVRANYVFGKTRD